MIEELQQSLAKKEKEKKELDSVVMQKKKINIESREQIGLLSKLIRDQLQRVKSHSIIDYKKFNDFKTQKQSKREEVAISSCKCSIF